MSRTVIAVVVAAVIAVLTAVAFFVTSASFDERTKKDADAQVTRSYQVIKQLTQLAGIDISTKAEQLRGESEFVDALKPSNADRQRDALRGFERFTNADKSATQPDILALIAKDGTVVAINGLDTVVAKQYQATGSTADDPKTVIPALDTVLKQHGIISDLWNYGDQGLMRIGVASIVDPGTSPTDKNPDRIVGAILIAYKLGAKDAQDDKSMIGTEIAYFDQKKVVATSFVKVGTNEDTAKGHELNALLPTLGDAKQKVSVDGVEYFVWAVKMPRLSTIKPLTLAPVTAGAMVLAPIVDGAGTPNPPNTAGTVKLFLLVVGIGALAIAMLGLYLSHRRLITQVDQVEAGVTDIINGNVDRTFRPVGPELDGLANGLNVMLARLLGRPEPGDEEFDDDGNPIMPGRVDFEEGADAGKGNDAELAALANESEPDYYKRVYTEYQAARKATGKPDDGSFENFIAKLKVNEGKLKAQFNCRAVRFRVISKDGKVSLKPVPIV